MGARACARGQFPGAYAPRGRVCAWAVGAGVGGLGWGWLGGVACAVGLRWGRVVCSRACSCLICLLCTHVLCATRALVSTWPHRGRSLCSARAPAFTLPHRGRLRLPHRGRFHLFEFAPWWAFMLAPFRGRWRQAHEKGVHAFWPKGDRPARAQSPFSPFVPPAAPGEGAL